HRTGGTAGEPGHIHRVEQRPAEAVVTGQGADAAVEHKAGQGVKMGLVHLDIVGRAEILHRGGVGLVGNLHQLGKELRGGQVVVEGGVYRHHIAVAHGGVAGGQHVVLNLRHRALEVGDDVQPL